MVKMLPILLLSFRNSGRWYLLLAHLHEITTSRINYPGFLLMPWAIIFTWGSLVCTYGLQIDDILGAAMCGHTAYR